MNNTKGLKKPIAKNDTDKRANNNSKAQATLFNYKTMAVIGAINKKFKKEVVSFGIEVSEVIKVGTG